MVTLREIFNGSGASAAPRPSTLARQAAARNWAANAAALEASHPSVLAQLRPVFPCVEWTFGRDGSLAARDEAGRWWAGCSLPLRTGRQLLKTMEVAGTTGVFLSPTTAGQVRAAIEKLRPTQAIVAVVPDERALRVMLHGDDFSAPIRARRLFFATGWCWPKQLARIFAEHPGLPLPLQFIRTAILDEETLSGMVTAGQEVIAAQANARAERLAAAQRRPRGRRTGKVCVVAPAVFRLWNFAGTALAAALLERPDERGQQGSPWVWLDPDDPATASPLALAEAAAGCDAMIAADTARADLPNIVPSHVPWVTWVTHGRIPQPDAAHPADGLLLADPAWRPAAVAAGWNKERIDVAGWPAFLASRPAESSGPARVPMLGLIADAVLDEPPQGVKDFSSHRLLWELIADQLHRDPMRIGDDPNAYLSSRMRKMSVSDEGFDRPLFFDKLILPAYLRGVARLLLRERLPLVLFGRGWETDEELRRRHLGVVASFEDLAAAAGACAALVCPSPLNASHPVDALGKPVVRRQGNRPAAFVAAARQALAAAPPVSSVAPLSAGRLLSVLPGFRFPAPGEDRDASSGAD